MGSSLTRPSISPLGSFQPGRRAVGCARRAAASALLHLPPWGFFFFWSHSYGYHVSPRLPPPPKKTAAHWLPVTKALCHWSKLPLSPGSPAPVSAIGPLPLSPGSRGALEGGSAVPKCGRAWGGPEPGLRQSFRGSCRPPRAGTGTAGGEAEAEPRVAAAAAGAGPAGVGAAASSTASCNSPGGRTCQVSPGPGRA